MATSPSEESLSRSGKARIREHELYWELHGSHYGPVVVLLHHGLGSIGSWRRQIPALVANGWRVLAYDRWGYGRSDPRPGFEPSFLIHDTEEAIRLLDVLDIERAAFIGHSDGGSIALLLGSRYPERVTSLVVVGAHVYIESKMRAGLDQIEADARVPPLGDVLTREHGERAEVVVADWINHWKGIDGKDFSLVADLGRVSCPALVIQGELDEHATPQHAIDIAAGTHDSELWLIPEVHHMPPHEIPEEFNRRVLAFLAKGKRG